MVRIYEPITFTSSTTIEHIIMNTPNIELKNFQYIVIFSNTRGYTERHYVSVPASMSVIMITEYVHAVYGRECRNEWRTAKPAEIENNEFEISEIQAPFLTN